MPLFEPIFRWEATRLGRSPGLLRHRTYTVGIVAALFLLDWLLHFGIHSPTAGEFARFGQQTVLKLTLLQITSIVFFATTAAVSLADDRARGRLELLRATGLGIRSIVIQKFLAAFVAACLPVAAGLPVYSMLLAFGGIAPDLVPKIVFGLLVSGFAVSSMSILAAVNARDNGTALANAYIGLFLWIAAPPLAKTPFMTVFGVWPAELEVFSPSAIGFALSISPCAWDTLWRAAAPTLLLSLAFLEIAARLLPREPRVARPSRSWFWRYRPSVDDHDPIGWRALHLNVYDRGGRQRLLFAMLLVALPVVAYFGIASGRGTLGTVTLSWMYCVGVVALYPISMFQSDRANGVHSMLAMTPLGAEEIHQATIRAAARRVRWGFCVPVAVECVEMYYDIFFPIGPRHVEYAVLRWCGHFLAYTPLVGLFWWSAKEAIGRERMAEAAFAAVMQCAFATAYAVFIAGSYAFLIALPVAFLDVHVGPRSLAWQWLGFGWLVTSTTFCVLFIRQFALRVRRIRVEIDWMTNAYWNARHYGVGERVGRRRRIGGSRDRRLLV